MSDKPSLLQEFKEFAVKGNVVDLAVGVIIGAAFGKIVTSVVNDLVMPMVSPLMHGKDLAGAFLALNGQHYDTLDAAKKANVGTLNYGLFLGNVIDFLIVAIVIFLMVKAINLMRRKEAAAPAAPEVAPAPTREEILLTEIRDALIARSAPAATTVGTVG
jgi:large conductance mechanosensitive channel